MWEALGAKLGDLGEGRIKQMDADGIDMQLLLLSAPGVQTLEEGLRDRARGNGERPARGGVPQTSRSADRPRRSSTSKSGQRAAQELQRAVRTLGLKGAVINSHTNGEYLDDRKFWPILECAAALDVPIYIHPRDPSPQLGGPLGIPGFLVGWGWALEVGTHAIRLIASGVFDEIPKLKIVIGHMGECIPFLLPRLDNRYTRDRGPEAEMEPERVFQEPLRGDDERNELPPATDDDDRGDRRRSRAVRRRLAVRAVQRGGRGHRELSAQRCRQGEDIPHQRRAGISLIA